MVEEKAELQRAWSEPKLLDAWGDKRADLIKEAESLEMENKLFGGHF